MKMEQSVPKRRHIKFRRRGITKNRTYKINRIMKAFVLVTVRWETSDADPNERWLRSTRSSRFGFL